MDSLAVLGRWAAETLYHAADASGYTWEKDAVLAQAMEIVNSFPPALNGLDRAAFVKAILKRSLSISKGDIRP